MSRISTQLNQHATRVHGNNNPQLPASTDAFTEKASNCWWGRHVTKKTWKMYSPMDDKRWEKWTKTKTLSVESAPLFFLIVCRPLASTFSKFFFRRFHVLRRNFSSPTWSTRPTTRRGARSNSLWAHGSLFQAITTCFRHVTRHDNHTQSTLGVRRDQGRQR